MLASTTLIDVWEHGQTLSSQRRAALALRAWEHGPGQPEEIPVDELNRHLLAMRGDLFGNVLELYSECEACGEAVEFAVGTDEIRSASDTVRDETLEFDGLEIECHPPSINEILQADQTEDPRRGLAELCVTSFGGRSATDVTVADLPDVVIGAIEEWLEDNHPLLDIKLEVACPDCDHTFERTLDLDAHLWGDIEGEARRVLAEVDLLARTYGWSERDILQMSRPRRSHYLELAR